MSDDTIRPATGLIADFAAAHKAMFDPYTGEPGDAWARERDRRTRARLEAARALLAAAAGRHSIEQAVSVFLELGPDGRWQLDSMFLDKPLTGLSDGSETTNCQHGDELGEEFDEECEAVSEAADLALALPSLDDLTAMIAAYRG